MAIRKTLTAVLAVLLLAPLAAAQPKAPALRIGDAEPVTIEWHHGIPFPGGWWRVDAVPAPGIAAQGFASQTRLLVDVFNVGEEPVRIAFDEVSGDPGEFDRVVPPSCGIGWSSAPPTLQAEDPGPGRWDKDYGPRAWPKVDVGWTFTTGSGRNRFFSAMRWRVDHGVLSRTMEAHLDRWCRWQLHRSYQDADAARALPRVLIGQKPGGGEWLQYETLPGDTVTPMDAHHFTVGVLADAWLLTHNPRALDQLIRALSWSLATQPQYDISTGDDSWLGVYGGIERVPGWLLCGLADGVEVTKDAGIGLLVERWTISASEHVDVLTKAGFNDLGLPNIVAPADAGRHIAVPFNAPWQGATVVFGLSRVADVIQVPNARRLAVSWATYLEDCGWDHDTHVFDAIPHNPEDQGVSPSIAGLPGIGLWPAPALIAAGRTEDDSPLLHMICEVARKTKYSGVTLFSPDGWVGYFGPLIGVP